jgi:hypothetical protein
VSYFISGFLLEKERELMKVIDGGYRRGLWLHDRDSITQEEVDFLNAAFREAGKHDPRWLKMIWDIKVESNPEMRRVK